MLRNVSSIEKHLGALPKAEFSASNKVGKGPPELQNVVAVATGIADVRLNTVAKAKRQIVQDRYQPVFEEGPTKLAEQSSAPGTEEACR